MSETTTKKQWRLIREYFQVLSKYTVSFLPQKSKIRQKCSLKQMCSASHIQSTCKMKSIKLKTLKDLQERHLESTESGHCFFLKVTSFTWYTIFKCPLTPHCAACHFQTSCVRHQQWLVSLPCQCQISVLVAQD